MELLPDSKAVVFRSTRSTLYGKIDKPGDEGGGLGVRCLCAFEVLQLSVVLLC